MPKLDLEVEGRIDELNLTEAIDKDGNKVDVSTMSSYELALKINSRELNVPVNLVFTANITYGSVTAFASRSKNGD
jgi:hypothetical protein